jgi:hypothetical protein
MAAVHAPPVEGGPGGAGGTPLLAEVRRLTEANRRAPDPAVEARLVWLRHGAFAELARQSGTPEPEPPADPFPDVVGAPPEIDAADLDCEVVRGAIAHHGCLLVRGMLPVEHCRRLVDDIDVAVDDALGGRVGTPFWAPFDPPDSTLEPGGRAWVVRSGTVYAADSPRVLFDLLETFEAVGAGELVTEYLGEPPALSLEKCAVRRVLAGPPAGWHQDGRFIGAGARVINLWAALSPCGRDAPALDLVPRRFDGTVRTGTGPGFDWCVGQDVVDEVTLDCPVVRPVFDTGDALLFDDMLLHRTGHDDTMTQPRYSIEAWFFAPSRYPVGTWVPIAY